MEDYLKINLSNYPERFSENSRELSISSKISFIFGKNGTGKTTIADSIKAQFFDTYNVCIFKDFDGIIENHRLNAVALGTENAEIQTKIEAIDKEIDEIKKEVSEPVDETKNLFIKLKDLEDKYKQKDTEIDNFFKNSAQSINKQSSPRIVSGDKTTYDKNDFKNEISSAKFISDDDIKRQKEIIRSDKKLNSRMIIFPNFDLSLYLKLTNEILKSSVSQQIIIDELDDNVDKQNFAKDGLRIHEHKTSEKCAFCGNIISEERWQLLDSYFNKEVNKLESLIEQKIKEINDKIGELNFFEEIDKNNFYDKFTEQIIILNLQFKDIKNEYKAFLENLKTALESKKKNFLLNPKN